jgi:hypothetical protein
MHRQEFYCTKRNSKLCRKGPSSKPLSILKLKAFHHLTEPRCSGRDWRSSQPTFQRHLLAPHSSQLIPQKCLSKSRRKTLARAQYASPFPPFIGLPPNHFHRKSIKFALRSPRAKSPHSKRCAPSSSSALNPRTYVSRAPSASPRKP